MGVAERTHVDGVDGVSDGTRADETRRVADMFRDHSPSRYEHGPSGCAGSLHP